MLGIIVYMLTHPRGPMGSLSYTRHRVTLSDLHYEV